MTSAQLHEPTAHEQEWDLLRLLAFDLAHKARLFHDNASALSVFVESAYSDNAELVPETGEETADLAMIRRMLKHVEGALDRAPQGSDISSLMEVVDRLSESTVPA